MVRARLDASTADPDSPRSSAPARLAYFTPVHEQPTLADRKAMFILAPAA